MSWGQATFLPNIPPPEGVRFCSAPDVYLRPLREKDLGFSKKRRYLTALNIDEVGANNK